MKIGKSAIAGSLESSDAMVTVEPSDTGIQIEIDSVVIRQFGKRIHTVVMETLDHLGVESGKVSIMDKGALDCTLKARVECAVYRSIDTTENLPWGGAIR